MSEEKRASHGSRGWITQALQFMRDCELADPAFWREWMQGEWKVKVKVTSVKGKLPCGCRRGRGGKLTQLPKCKREHYNPDTVFVSSWDSTPTPPPGG